MFLLYESHVCVVSLMTDNSTGDNQWQKIVYFFKKWSLLGQKRLILHFSWINSRPSINRLPQIIAYLLGIPIVLKKWRIDSAKLISDDSSSDAEDIDSEN